MNYVQHARLMMGSTAIVLHVVQISRLTVLLCESAALARHRAIASDVHSQCGPCQWRGGRPTAGALCRGIGRRACAHGQSNWIVMIGVVNPDTRLLFWALHPRLLEAAVASCGDRQRQTRDATTARGKHWRGFKRDRSRASSVRSRSCFYKVPEPRASSSSSCRNNGAE